MRNGNNKIIIIISILVFSTINLNIKAKKNNNIYIMEYIPKQFAFFTNPLIKCIFWQLSLLPAFHQIIYGNKGVLIFYLANNKVNDYVKEH